MTLSKLDVGGYALLVSNFELNISMLDRDRKPITLKISDPPPLTNFTPKLTEQQVQGLWLITEGGVTPRNNARPGWWLAKELKMPLSNISRRVTTPLEKRGLICFEYRPTTRPKSRNPNKEEKAWHLKRASMRTVFDILFSIFLKCNFNDLLWPGREHGKILDKNITANTRCLTLAYLQKKIMEYENSKQYFIDLGVKPPLGMSKIELEKVFLSRNLKKSCGKGTIYG
jgi:hypothetical protein